jgi:2-methylcitrate dehydratase PrpD
MIALASVASSPAGPTRIAASLVSGSTFDDLPDDVIELARQCILDTIGVMVAGAREPVAIAVLEQAVEDGGAAQATVIGHDCRLPLRAAALVNGTAGHALDYDDCNLTMSGHVSIVVLPAVLALAEHRRASGRDLINAFVAGFETACRIGSTVAPGHYDRGFHATGTIGAFAAAAGSARIMGLNADATANAFGIAGTMAAGLKCLFGTMCKPFHAGRAAENGLYAAQLSSRGLQARDDVLECRQGFAASFAPHFSPDMVDTPPPRGFHIRHNLFKYHAACYGVHGAIECARLLGQRIGPDIGGIRRMTLEVAVENDKTCNIPTPRRAAEARFSLRHCVAMVLAGHDTGVAEAYGDPSLSDPRVAQTRDKIAVSLVPGIDIADSRLIAEMADGTTHRIEFDATKPANDLALQRQRLSAKFDTLVQPVLGAERSCRLRDTILRLDAMNDVSELARLCAHPRDSSLAGSPDERAQIADALDSLCNWAHRAARDSLPEDVRVKSALVLIDDLAAACAAHAEPEIHELLKSCPENGEATLLQPGSPRTDKRHAALVNGVAGCWAELDEGYRSAPAHAALYILPALLAEAEARDARTDDVIASLVVAYEAVARLAETWRFPVATIHPHAALGGIGAAIGASIGRRVDAAMMANALRIAGGLVPAGTYQAAIEGALVRNIWTGHGALTGLYAVDWAEAGFSGFPDGPNTAFANLLNAMTHPDSLLERLGERWAILGCYHKLHGCCHSTHTAVEAALDLRSRFPAGKRTTDILALNLRTHRPTMSNPSPANTLAARFSFEHVVASALVVGHAGPEAFTRAAIADAEIARLRPCVSLERYEHLPPWPQDRPAHLTMTFADGVSIDAECLSAPGGPDRPLSANALIAKAEGLTRAAFPNFATVAKQLVAGERGVLEQSWRSTLSAMLARA